MWRPALAMPVGAQMFSGSVGKIFVSALALRLAQEGRLHLQDKVTDYFGEQEWYRELPNAEELTIYSLLTHTSGLGRYIFQPSFEEDLAARPQAERSPEECLGHLGGTPAVHPVDKGWGYSDSNFLLLGLVLEAITDSTYYDLLRYRILEPYGLEHTYPSTQSKLPGLTPGYIGQHNFFNLPEIVGKNELYPINPQFEWTGGGLVTNVDDLSRWLHTFHTGDFLEEQWLYRLRRAVGYRDGQAASFGYGLGSFTYDTPQGTQYGHAGIFPRAPDAGDL